MEVLKLFQKDLEGQAMQVITMEVDRKTVIVNMDLTAHNGVEQFEIKLMIY